VQPSQEGGRNHLADEGEGFDPDQLPDPLSPEGVLRGSGRGVFLARAFMDELEVRRDAGGWTTVTMTKFVDSVGAGLKAREPDCRDGT
jgi:anti-sigma regulatory factor (Ser/Thr protein kinase)